VHSIIRSNQQRKTTKQKNSRAKRFKKNKSRKPKRSKKRRKGAVRERKEGTIIALGLLGELGDVDVVLTLFGGSHGRKL